MEIKASYRGILRIAGPLILADIVGGVGQIIDTAFVNRIGANELNGTVMGSMIWMFFSFILIGFSTYAQRLIAIKVGAGKQKKIGKIIDNMLIIGFGLLACLVGMYLIIRFGGLQRMIMDTEIIKFTFIYMDTVTLALPIAILIHFFSAFFVAIGNTRVITYSVFVYIIVNLILDYALIFGHFGLPELGVHGAALATLLAMTCSFLVYVSYFTKDIINRYNLFKFKKLNRKFIKKVVSKSYPLVLQNLLNVTVAWIFFMMIEKMGSKELRVSFIIRSLYLFVCIPIFGLGQAVNTVISNMLGRGDKEQVAAAVFRSHQISLGVSLILCIAIFVFPDLFLSIYANDPTEIYEALSIINVILISILLFSVSTVNMNAIIALGDTRAIFFIGLISLLSSLLFSYVSIFEWKSSITVVWMSEWVNWGLFMLLSSMYFMFWKIKMQKSKNFLIKL